MRADVLLVQRQLAPTRSAAQRLIERGAVSWRSCGPIPGAAPDWQMLSKAGLDLGETSELRILDDAEIRWASRAGLKLAGALQAWSLSVEGACCLDLGQSTGGFTDVLLHGGAAKVLGVEVGHGQLLPRLAQDPRVEVLEHCDARDLPERLPSAWGKQSIDWVVGDLSFVSQTKVLPAVSKVLSSKGQVLMLVKPQFELQAIDIGKGGMVKDPARYADVEQRLRSAYALSGLKVLHYGESVITGGDGNREFFIHAQVDNGLGSDSDDAHDNSTSTQS